MPNPDRRSGTGKPPMYLMQSYSTMAPQKKKELKRLGYGLLIFSLVVPVLASIGLHAIRDSGLPIVIWLFCGVGMILGLSLAWPELGIYMLGRLPAAVGKLLPKSWASALTRAPERRNNDQ